MRSTRTSAAALLATASIVLAGCGGTGGSTTGGGGPVGEPQRGGSIVFGLNTSQASLDPARCRVNQGWGVCEALYGTLMTWNFQAKKFEPGMAQSFESTDGVNWTLKLRPGTTFSDGSPFDAAAVVADWDRVKDPKNLSPAASIAAALQYSAVDATTVKVVSPTPNYQLPWSMTQDALATVGAASAARAGGAVTDPVGAGPFTLSRFTEGTETVVARNPKYWDQPRPYVDEITYRVIRDADLRMQAFKAGEIDVDMDFLASIKRAGAESAEIVDIPAMIGSGFGFNHKLVPEPIRRAINMVIDQQQITNAVYAGESLPRSFVSPDSGVYDDRSLFAFPGSLDEAQRLVDGYLAQSGRTSFAIEYNFPAGVPIMQQTAEVLQSQVRKIRGLTLSVVPLESAALFSRAAKGTAQMGLGAVIGVNPDQLYRTFRTGSSANVWLYSNPEVDAALDRTHTAADPAAQNAAYRDAIAIMAKDPAIRTYRQYEIGMIPQPTVHGVVPSGTADFRPELVWKQQ